MRGRTDVRKDCDKAFGRNEFPNLAGRASARLNNRSPAIEIIPMMNTRINHTIKATKTGTTFNKVLWLMIDVESS